MTRLEPLLISTLLIVSNHRVCYGNEFSISPEVVQWGTDIVKVGIKMAKGNPVKIAFGLTTELGQVIDYYKNKPDTFSEKMINLSNELDSLVINVTNVQKEIIDQLTAAIPNMHELQNCLNDISKTISYIEGKFSDYIAFVRKPLDFEKVSFIDFADSITSYDIHGLPHLLNALHEAFYMRNEAISGDTVLSLLAGNTVANQKMCERKQSLQQMLYILHTAIGLADIKGYTMMQAAYDFKAAFIENARGFKGEKERAETLFRERMQRLFQNVKSAMKSSPRAVWTCDSVYEEGVTYTKFNNLFSSYILNEMSLNFLNTCVGECESFYSKKAHNCQEELCKKQKKCLGDISDCKTITRPAYICLSNESVNERKYDSIEWGESKKSCPNSMVQANSWRIITTDSCDYCMCTCDSTEDPESDRYVNLRPVTADMEENYVVTGLRFVKKHHVLHIQIKQGELLPGGAINESTNHWKPIEAYEIGKIIPGTVQVPSAGDYHKLEWAVFHNKSWLGHWNIVTKAAFNLDDVDLSDLSKDGRESFEKIMNFQQDSDWGDLEPYQYHLVTGVRIQKTNVKDSGYHLYLDVQMTPFNYTTGQVYPNKTFWYSKHTRFTNEGFEFVDVQDKAEKVEIKLDNLDLPINQEVRAKPSLGKNQYVKLTTSSVENDAGQNTLPFIDITSVETTPPAPISGVGLMHKSSSGTGGFLALKLFTIDYEPYMEVHHK